MGDTNVRHGRWEAGRTRAPAARREAFATLADHHLASAYRLAGVILGDPADAEDATHDAVVTAWRSFGSLRDPARFEQWFSRILVNVCRDRLRKRRRTPVVELDLGRAVAGRDPIHRVDDRVVLDRAFERLTADQRIVVALRFWADLTIDDIAERVGVPAGTVKSRLHTAIGRLRGALADDKEAVR